jgi:hypothetical protein
VSLPPERAFDTLANSAHLTPTIHPWTDDVGLAHTQLAGGACIGNYHGSACHTVSRTVLAQTGEYRRNRGAASHPRGHTIDTNASCRAGDGQPGRWRRRGEETSDRATAGDRERPTNPQLSDDI